MEYVIMDNDPRLIFKNVTITKLKNRKYKFEGTHIGVTYCKKNSIFSDFYFKLEPSYRKKLNELALKDKALIDNNNVSYYTNIFEHTHTNDLSFFENMCYYVFYFISWFLTLTIIRPSKRLFVPLRITNCGYYATGVDSEVSKELNGSLETIIERTDDVRPFIKNFIKKWD
jgi:hypothetical protein